MHCSNAKFVALQVARQNASGNKASTQASKKNFAGLRHVANYDGDDDLHDGM